MAEYIEREAAIEQIKTEWAKTPLGEITGFAVFMRVLTKLPAADVAPVVRCKECRHRDPEDHKCDSGEMERQRCPFPVHDNYFCAYGARMDGGEE